jgi:sortase (surface protein transpeptidase)
MGKPEQNDKPVLVRDRKGNLHFRNTGQMKEGDRIIREAKKEEIKENHLR